MRRSALLRLLPLVFVAACLPSRDNPDDPGVGPLAKLRVLDEGWPDASTDACAAPDPAALLPEVAVASHGRCLVLDASLTTDRNGQPLAGATYEFRLLADDGSSTVIAPAGSAIRVLLPASLRASLPENVAVSLQLVVTAGSHRARAQSSVVLTNAPPTVIGDPTRVVPVGGYPWAPAASYTLPFYGDDTTDLDGDDVGLCWHFHDGQPDPPCRHRHDPPVLRNFPSSAGEFVAWVVASDGHGAPTHAAPSIVYVRTGPVWAAPAGGFAVLDADEQATVGGGIATAGAPSAFLDRGTSSRLINGTTSGTLGLYSWPDTSTLLSSATKGTAQPLSLIVDDVNGRVWGVNVGNGAAGVTSWLVSGDTITGELAVPGPASDLGGGFIAAMGEVDAVGRLWVAVAGRDELETVDPSGATTFFHPGPLDGFSRRPGSGEMWAMVEGTSAESSIVRWTGGASDTPEAVLADPELYRAQGPYWVDADTFWLLLETQGVVLVDADALLAGAPLADAILDQQPLTGTLQATKPNALVDPLSGALTFCSAENYVTVAVPFGRAYSSPTDSGCSLSSIDAQGRLRYAMQILGSGIVVLAERSGVDLSIGAAPLFNIHLPLAQGAAYAARNHSDGSLWIASTAPSLVQLFPDGRQHAIGTWVDSTNTVQPMPGLQDITLSADGTTMWAFTHDPVTFAFGGLVRIAVGGTSLRYSTIPIAQSAALDIANGADIAAHAPAGDYVFGRVNTTNVVSKIDAAGTITPLVTLTEANGNTPVRLAAGADGGLCIADGPYTPNAGTNYFIRMRHMTAQGSVDQTQDVSISTQFNFMASLSANPAGDGCWVAWFDAVSANAGGIDELRGNAILHSATISNGEPVSVVGIGAHEAWVTQTPDTYHFVTTHLTFTTTAGSTLKESRVVDGMSGPLYP